MKKGAISTLIGLVGFFLILTAGAAFAGKKSRGQTVYVPATYMDNSDYDEAGNVLRKRIHIAQVNVRNVDPNNSIILTSVNFHDPDGQLVKEYLEESQVIDPLASVTFYAMPSVLGIPLYDLYEGRPCFIVTWEADKKVIPPRVPGIGIVVVVGSEPGTRTVEGITSGLETVIEERRGIY